jgi:ADP-heptose:LPS heptosyltransferase
LGKILIIRFSAIGDIVLTTPVIRSLKKQIPGAEIHMLVKSKFRESIETNPHISTFHFIEKHPDEVIETLRKEKFDYIIDLQKNDKSSWVCSMLYAKHYSFPKLNFKKFLLVKFKINKMPNMHVVDRYFEAVKKLGVKNDQQGLEFFLKPQEELFSMQEIDFFKTKYVALVLGATYYTKRIPQQKLEEVILKVNCPIVLLGGPAEAKLAEELSAKFSHTVNTVGKTSLQQSAHYIKNAAVVITSDTGLMHIAAAFRKRIVSIWGNTVPLFGMYPYMPGENSVIVENNSLDCRPCSKLGFDKCPKKHFKCMLDHDSGQIASMVEQSF